MAFTKESSALHRSSAIKARQNWVPAIRQAHGVTNRMFKLLCMNADQMIESQAGQISGEQAQVLLNLARAWVAGQERVDFIKGRGKPAERPAELPKPKLRKLLIERQVAGKVIDICCGPAPVKQDAAPTAKSS